MGRTERHDRARALPAVLRFTLDSLPPSSNGAYRNVPKVGRVLTGTAKAWKRAANLVISNAVQRQAWELPPKTPWALEVRFTFPQVNRSDLSGRLKLLEDVIASVIHVDDRYVRDIRLIKLDGPERVECVVRRWEGQDNHD